MGGIGCQPVATPAWVGGLAPWCPHLSYLAPLRRTVAPTTAHRADSLNTSAQAGAPHRSGFSTLSLTYLRPAKWITQLNLQGRDAGDREECGSQVCRSKSGSLHAGTPAWRAEGGQREGTCTACCRPHSSTSRPRPQPAPPVDTSSSNTKPRSLLRGKALFQVLWVAQVALQAVGVWSSSTRKSRGGLLFLATAPPPPAPPRQLARTASACKRRLTTPSRCPSQLT